MTAAIFRKKTVIPADVPQKIAGTFFRTDPEKITNRETIIPQKVNKIH